MNERLLTVAGGSSSDGVEGFELDNVVHFLAVSGSHGTAHELGKATVKGLLSSLETGAGGSATPGLLSSHTETTSSTLTSGDTTALAILALASTRGCPNIVKGPHSVFHIVQLGLIRLSSLPVKNLHGHTRPI
jgi:hypothetical protein